MHGDKDTFALAYPLAGKAEEFHQLRVPPGAGLCLHTSTNG